MTNFYIRILSNKPKEDVNEIVERMGFVNIAPQSSKRGGIAHFFTKLLTLFNILLKMKRGDQLLIQYPMKKFVTPATWCAHCKGARVVAIIHDLGCFRRKKLTVRHEMRRMNRIDSIIVHNPSMKKFMEDNGCIKPLHVLGIFDYLSDATPREYTTPHQPWSVVYAGGLGSERSPFLYEIDAAIEGWNLQLYGTKFEPERATSWKWVHFKGAVTPDQLISGMEADFGLVWDGTSLDECAGPWGEYLCINNPHKTSLYLRAGIPVIIWSRAALASFVLEHQVGLAVDSIRDIGKVLSGVTHQQYAFMKENARKIGAQIASGSYTTAALERAFDWA